MPEAVDHLPRKCLFKGNHIYIYIAEIIYIDILC